MTTRREVENSKIRFVFELLELLSSSSSSSSDEDEYFKTPHKIRKIGNFIELVHECTDKEFKSHFRIARSTAYKIIDIYADSQFYPSDRTHGGSEPTSAELDILSFLWFAGNKVCLRDVSQRFGVCPVTSLRQHNRVMNYLINLAPNIMKFDEKEQVANEFFEIAGFPQVLGCIDCTSIKVRTPRHKIKSTYVNRHDIPSITLQGICDARKRFVDVFTGIPAKIHDSRVLKLSDINENLPGICEQGKFHILGDSAYSIREWLMIPFRDYGNLSDKQRKFNKRFCATRVKIENAFGLLKARF
ncbi:PREDICTED: putative nuclease HARBI1 isoform X1 [Trachymyrmex cornetzi]|uniref:putative nuclease HARBI1 isoform X1 n=1 Tax=Trachymyrmex cornetzi TaxID=471704 RepID=UPI00084EEE92|nr:PREDICTED: putative nuclease HARBI1 isoform X1 [Trachymyrmex cornetzi]